MRDARYGVANRREVLQALSVAAASVAASAARPAGVLAPADRPQVSFLGLGDWGRRGDRQQRQIAEAMAAAAEVVASRFVVSVGDNFYEGGVRSVADPHWRQSFEEVYTAPSLQTPWYAVLGNHDHRGSAQAQVDYSCVSPRWRMPDRYFQVSGAAHGAPDLDLFFLDTAPLVAVYGGLALRPSTRRAAAAQLAWLKAGLATSGAACKLVVGHHTVHSGGSRHGDTLALVTHLKPLLEAHGVQAYLNGHDHDLQHVRRGGVDYIGTGAGSQARPVNAIEGTRFCLARPGFAVLTFDAGRLSLAFRDLAGESLYNCELQPAGA